jgi:hypothetical protein
LVFCDTLETRVIWLFARPLEIDPMNSSDNSTPAADRRPYVSPQIIQLDTAGDTEGKGIKQKKEGGANKKGPS